MIARLSVGRFWSYTDVVMTSKDQQYVPWDGQQCSKSTFTMDFKEQASVLA